MIGQAACSVKEGSRDSASAARQRGSRDSALSEANSDFQSGNLDESGPLPTSPCVSVKQSPLAFPD